MGFRLRPLRESLQRSHAPRGYSLRVLNVRRWRGKEGRREGSGEEQEMDGPLFKFLNTPLARDYSKESARQQCP